LAGWRALMDGRTKEIYGNREGKKGKEEEEGVKK
jgi:hypothetical protein